MADDIYSLLMADEPTAQQQAAAMAAALRRERGVANASRALGNLGMLTGDRVLSGFGRAQLQDAQQADDSIARQEGQLGQIGQFRLSQAMAKQRAAQEAAHAAAQMKQQQSQFDAKMGLERAQLGLARERLAAEREAAGLKAAAHDDGKALPVAALEGLAGVDTAKKELDKLGQSFRNLGESGAWAKFGALATNLLGLQGTDAAAYNTDAVRTMQSVGKILEGGKLAAGDEVKYAKMLPRPGDPPELVTRKIDGLKDMLDNWRASTERQYSGSGYKVIPGTTDQKAAAEFSAEDEARLAELEKLAATGGLK